MRLTHDDDGNMGMTFGMIFAVLIGCIGAGYDMNQLVSTKQKASSIADTAVLTAAIYYSAHGEPPQSLDQGLVHGHVYNAEDLNYSFNSLSSKMAKDVKIKVTYDEVNKESTAHVWGHTQVAFMQIFGHSKLKFNTTSVAKFSEVELKDPATIAFVLDNSGSMEFDDLPYGQTRYPLNSKPAGTQKRLPALETSVKAMMAKLRGVMNNADGDSHGRNQRDVRTLMFPYSSEILLNNTVDGQWGLLTNGQIEAMKFETGTNSAPPLDDALDVMRSYNASDPENEAKIHIDEHGEDPLRYVIFMTDGQNSGDYDIWDPREGTGTWRRWGRHVKCSYNSSTGYYYRDDDGPYNCQYSSDRWIHVNNSEDEPEDYSGWEEGTYDNQSNLDSRSTCAEMHAEGVEVFTIAFGLQKGWYYTNNWGIINGGGDYNQWEVKQQEVNNALSLMEFCASSPQHYTEAIDSVALDAAFQKIGDSIVKELIRLKS